MNDFLDVILERANLEQSQAIRVLQQVATHLSNHYPSVESESETERSLNSKYQGIHRSYSSCFHVEDLLFDFDAR